MIDWVARALAENETGETHCQNCQKVCDGISEAVEITAKTAKTPFVPPFGSFGSANAGLPEISRDQPTNERRTAIKGPTPQTTAKTAIPHDAYALTRHGVFCRTCQTINRGYPLPEGGYVCAVCAEWRIAGCAYFTLLDGADEAEAARTGCCLACGSSIQLHGSPSPLEWRRVASVEAVELAAVRFVLAKAVSIARGTAR